MTFRAMTAEEILDFKERHPWYWFPYIPSQGIYIYDSILNGYVLVFKLQNGDVTFTFTSNDPAVDDPSKTGYIIKETGKAIVQSTKSTFGALGQGLSTAYSGIVILGILIIAILILKK